MKIRISNDICLLLEVMIFYFIEIILWEKMGKNRRNRMKLGYVIVFKDKEGIICNIRFYLVIKNLFLRGKYFLS